MAGYAAARGQRPPLGRLVHDAADGDGILVIVRRGKDQQRRGETKVVRFVKGVVARAIAASCRDAAGDGFAGGDIGEQRRAACSGRDRRKPRRSAALTPLPGATGRAVPRCRRARGAVADAPSAPARTTSTVSTTLASEGRPSAPGELRRGVAESPCRSAPPGR